MRIGSFHPSIPASEILLFFQKCFHAVCEEETIFLRQNSQPPYAFSYFLMFFISYKAEKPPTKAGVSSYPFIIYFLGSSLIPGPSGNF